MLWDTCTWRRKFGTNGKTMPMNFMFDIFYFYYSLRDINILD